MSLPTIRPHALKPGDTVGVIAPAGPVETREAFLAGVERIERLGFHVKYRDRIFQSTGYLAGSDSERAAELIDFFRDPEVRAIIPLRGGYGCSRLVRLFDKEALKPNAKVFMGFSDLTTLHLLFRRCFGWITFHGPMMISSALSGMGEEEARHFVSLWTDPGYLPAYSPSGLQSWTDGVAEGELTGGCLSIVAASIGTEYEIRTEGRILFLEDLGEPAYRIDRMLTHLELAGKLDRVAGIVLGTFQDCEPPKGGTVQDTLRERLERLQVPTVYGFPSGHGTANTVLPLGVRVRLDCGRRRLICLEPAVE